MPGPVSGAVALGPAAEGQDEIRPESGCPNQVVFLAAALADDLREGDQVVCLGAGDITRWAAALAPAVAARKARLAEDAA